MTASFQLFKPSDINNMPINVCKKIKRRLRRQSSCDEQVKKNKCLRERQNTSQCHINRLTNSFIPHSVDRTSSGSILLDTTPNRSSLVKSHQVEEAFHTPAYSFGLIADVQYADRDNVEKYSAGRWRFYRSALDHVRYASNMWQHGDGVCTPKQKQSSKKPAVNFAVQLGDIIDGYNADVKESDAALVTVLDAFKDYTGDLHHVWGNHEMYNFTRKELHNSRLGDTPGVPQDHRKPSGGHYYSFSPVEGFRFILLDTYEMSVLGYDQDDPIYLEAHKILKSENPNEDLNCSNGMKTAKQHYVVYNGGVTDEQLHWFKKTLHNAYNNREQVIIAGHNPLYARSSDHSSLCWNSSALLEEMHKYPGCVRAYFCGHDHNGGFATDDAGIHHLTIPGVVETGPESSAYGTVHVYGNRLELCTPKGGRLDCKILPYREE